MGTKLDLVPLAKTDYQKLDTGDIIYDEKGTKWKVTAIKFSKTIPTSREISVKHGLRSFAKFRITATGSVGEKLFKEKGKVFATAKAPKKGIVRGAKVIAKVPLEWGEKKVSAGTRGIVTDIRSLTPAQSKQFHGGQKAFLSVKWAKGGTFMNVYPSQVKLA